MKATVNINEAAKILKVSRRTIYYWISKGYLSALDGPGRGWRIPTAELTDNPALVKWSKRKVEGNVEATAEVVS